MHYREAVVWQKAMAVARGTYGLAKALPKEEVFAFRSQMTRAAVSVPCNIAEGWTRESRKDKAHFLAIAQGSAAELETLVTLAEDIGWFDPRATRPVRQTLDEVSRMLTVLRQRSRASTHLAKPGK